MTVGQARPLHAIQAGDPLLSLRSDVPSEDVTTARE